MSTAIHIEFARTDDARDAYPTICRHVDDATLGLSTIDVACEADDAARVRHELEHALDEWLVERRLPFAPLSAGPHTLVVRPPGD